ncbi:MAG: glycine cleavage system aminomethyltransferase GcvT [Clostridia bacterium]|nr:glycine cleavage system aminomethyltransferase GcvT [Clostridia bacterium]
MELKTPLYDTHVKYGGKIVPFAGYLLPVQYSGVIAEHMAVRNAAGLFDVSHMGEVILKGKDALANLNRLMTNDFTDMYDGQARYSPMCNSNGGVVDDLIVYKINDETYFIVINASNRHKDVAWMKEHIQDDVTMEDISDSVAQIALQGPKAKAIMEKIVPAENIPQKNYSFIPRVMIGGAECILSFTGYTGEDGYEIYTSPENAAAVWELLMENGKEEGLIPCGLGARDTLRLEAAMPLYGHEMTDDITPIESGLGFFVKMNKEDFIGKQGIIAKGEQKIKRVGLKVVGRGIIREHCDLYDGDKKIGVVSSGTHCPCVGTAVGMALVDIEYAAVGTTLEADVRGRRVAVEVIKLPFYKKGEVLVK